MNVQEGRRAFLSRLLGGKWPARAPSEDRLVSAGSLPEAGPDEEKGTARALSELYAMAVEPVLGKAPAEPDYEALLPADFTPSLLRMEALRLGLDPDSLSRQELAREILRAMGALPESASRSV